MTEIDKLFTSWNDTFIDEVSEVGKNQIKGNLNDIDDIVENITQYNRQAGFYAGFTAAMKICTFSLSEVRV